jgi:hypothetical protein
MKKSIVAILFALASTNASATLFQLDDNEKEVAYAETNTIKKSGDIVTMWSLYDLKNQKYLAKKPYQSTKFQMEFQCKKELVRLRGMKFFSGKMGEGQVIYNESFTDIWTPITDVEPEWYFACYNR